jgi:hypothetical protein
MIKNVFLQISKHAGQMYSKSQLLNFFNRKKTPLFDNYLFLTYVCRLENFKKGWWIRSLKHLRILINRSYSLFFVVLCHVVYLILASPFIAFSQTGATQQTITDSLKIAGFENIFIETKPDTLTVFLENRRYRFDPRGLAEAAIIIQQKVNDAGASKLQLVLLQDKVAMVQVVMPMNILGNYAKEAIGDSAMMQLLYVSLDVPQLPHKASIANSSLFKVDLPILLTWNAKFGNFSNPVESNINIIPELNSTLAKGLTLKAQLIIPVQNDFFFVGERETVRPGHITLNQFASLADNFYINITAGTFNKNRAGCNIELKKLLAEGRIGLGANVGYTRYYSFTGIETEFYDQQPYLTALLTAEYRYNPFDLIARLQVGNFLFNVPALRFDLMRQFGEVQIGFMALATKDDFDGGFRFVVPLPPRKYTRLRFFRIRPADNFAWEYRAKGFPQNGVTYNTGYNLTDMLVDYNPDFIKKRLIIEIKTQLNK